jgi:hypothetical protein
MKTNILLIYAYLVCFVTVTCGAIYTGIILYDIVQISAPEFMLSEHTKYTHANNENFIENNYTYTDDGKVSKYEGYSETKITKIRTENYQSKIAQEQNNAVKSVIQSVIVLFIDLILFFVHWRIAKRARENV